MTRREALTLIAATTPLLAGTGSKNTRYVGGTWTNVKEGSEGKLDLSSETALAWRDGTSGKEIPYASITTLEYGQKAGRRVGATIALGVTTLGIGALPMLFSKKRKHFLSIGFKDAAGKDQGIVLELGKNITRTTLMVVETRSGKKVEYESDEARKHAGN